FGHRKLDESKRSGAEGTNRTPAFGYNLFRVVDQPSCCGCYTCDRRRISFPGMRTEHCNQVVRQYPRRSLDCRCCIQCYTFAVLRVSTKNAARRIVWLSFIMGQKYLAACAGTLS